VKDSATDTALEAVLKRDRFVLATGLLLVIVAAWVWIMVGAGMSMNAFEMTTISKQPDIANASAAVMKDTVISDTSASMLVMQPAVWTPGYALLMFSMWWVMMVAMMLPSAAPVLLLFARINRKQKNRAEPLVPTSIFALGYIVVWGGFSAVAAALQWSLERSGALSQAMVSTSLWLGAGILIAAGLWQLTPIKSVCLRHCRTPLGFLISRWRPGRSGALHMGLEHGAYCLGCCWFLMALLFFGGVMNLYWIAGLAVFVLLEKTIPFGNWLGRVVGIVLIGCGAVLPVL
jgi:predicted metal-binding membrane protein